MIKSIDGAWVEDYQLLLVDILMAVIISMMISWYSIENTIFIERICLKKKGFIIVIYLMWKILKCVIISYGRERIMGCKLSWFERSMENVIFTISSKKIILWCFTLNHFFFQTFFSVFIFFFKFISFNFILQYFINFKLVIIFYFSFFSMRLSQSHKNVLIFNWYLIFENVYFCYHIMK